MLTIREAATALGLSEGRTRALVASGKLKAQKRGRQWEVFERSVEERLAQDVHAGRPRKEDVDAGRNFDPVSDQAYSLFLACREQVSRGRIASLIQNAQSAEERDFYVCLFNFFLNHSCEKLVKAGVY